MVSAFVIWAVFVVTACNLRPASAATFTVIKVPLFISPLTDIPRPDEFDDEVSRNNELYSKATIYDDWNLSVYSLDVILSGQIKTVINDIGVLLDRNMLKIDELTAYNCTRWCHYVNISDVTRVTGKTVDELKGNPPITVLEMHNAVVKTMEDIYCFNMTALETNLGMKSTNVTEKEWALFIPEMVKAAIQCRADRLGVTPLELAELLRGNLTTFYSYGLDDLTSTFFPNYSDLEMRKNEFETKSFDIIIASKSWTSAQGQTQTMLYFADHVARFSIRDLEILYGWGKPQLFAIENIPLSSYMTECSVATSVALFDMSKSLFGQGATVPSCNVAFALSRSLNEIEVKFNNLATIENRNVLYIFINATDITSWFHVDNILQLDIDEGIWVEIPFVTHVASANGKTTAYTRTCSIPQIISSIKSLNQSGALTSYLSINHPLFQDLLFTTYGYSKNELMNETGLSLQQINAFSIAELHALILNEITERYNFTDLAAIIGINGVDSFVLSTLPSFEWYRIVRAGIERSFTVAADAVSINVASSNNGLRVITRLDGNPSVQISPGSVYFSPRITTDSLATCLLGRNKADIYSMSFAEYHKIHENHILPIVNGKVALESQTLISILTKNGLTLNHIENRTVAEIMSEQTGLSVQHLGCLYGWNSAFLELINQITWGNVSAFRICDDYQVLTLHKILDNLLTAQPKNCFGYISLTPTTYSIQEADGFVDVSLELLGGDVDSVVKVKLSVVPLTATLVNDFENLTSAIVTYNIGEVGRKSVRVNISDDAIVEDDETFDVFISSLDSRTKVRASVATITILDDDFVSVAFQVNPAVVAENVGNVTANVVLTGEIERSIRVSWAVKDSTTTSSDYRAVTGPDITFEPNGAKTKSVVIVINDDSVIEGIEAFTLTLSSSDTHVNTSEQPVIIQDNDKLTVSFVTPAYTADEDQGSVQLSVRALGVLSISAFVRLRTLNDDAIAGNDYVATSTILEFTASASGIRTINVPVSITNDNFIESAETFTASLSKANINDDLLTIANPSTTTVTITDDDQSTVNFKNAAFAVVEDQGFVTINVTLVGSLEKAVTVGYSTVSGTATTSDFTLITGSIEFKPGDPLEKSFAISITEDSFVEAPEQFEAVLTSVDPQAVIGSQGKITVTIIDNDVASVEHVQTSYSFSEDVGNGELGVRLAGLAGPLQTNITVSVKVNPVSAILTSDYTDPPSTITFNTGDFNTTKYILLPITNDSIFEVAERLLVLLDDDVDPKVNIKAPDVATVTITDDDSAAIDFSQRVYNVSENDDAVIELRVTSGQLGTPVTVGVTTSTSTAENADFLGVTTSVTFSTGETGPKSIIIDLVDDLVVEPPETFTVALTSSSPLTLGPAASVNIIDNDNITVVFGASSYQVTEGNPTVTLRVVAIGQTTIQLPVSVTTENSSAKAGSDFTATQETLTFNSGDSVKQVTVNIIDDEKIERVESFIARLTSANTRQVKLGIVTSTEITIIDDDFATIQFSTNLFTGNETSGFADISVILTGALESNVEASVTTIDGTASSGLDYGRLSDYQITYVPGGPTVQYIRINVTDDSLIEGIERFSVSLSSSSSFVKIGNVNVTTVRIIDNDVATISFVNAPSISIDEGKAGSLNVEVAGPLNTEVTATATVIPVTAGNADFSVVSSTSLTFGPSLSTTGFVVITTDDDVIIEGDETFRVELNSTSTNVKINDGVVTVTIKDNDRANVTLSTSSYSGSEASRDVEISLNIQGQLETTVTTSLSLSTNTAQSTDYQSLVNSLVNFSPDGATTQNRTITIVDDGIVESTESFTVTVTAVSNNVDIGPTDSAVIEIQDNDAATISFASTAYFVQESDGRAILTVVLLTSASLQRPVTFSFSTLNNTAISPGDFAKITTGQFTFNSGEDNGATRQISVGINDDEVVESSEYFRVKLEAVTADTIGSNGTANVTITDNDIPSIRLLESKTNVAESGNEVTVRAFLTGSLDREVTARLITSNLSATANQDYEPADEVLTFTPNAQRQELKIKVNEDVLVEGLEQFTVTITSSDANIESPNSTTITILDNDVLTVGFATSTLSVAESDREATVSVTLTGTLAIPVNFTTTAANLTARNNEDYTYNEQTITVNPSHGSSQIFIIPVNDDLIVENDESFTVLLIDTSDLVEIRNGLLTITIVDDDRATVRFSSSMYNVKEKDLAVVVGIECTSDLETSVIARVTSLDATAVSGGDYIAIENQIVTFSPRNITQTLAVSITDDVAVENTESFSLYLSTGGSSKVLIGSPNMTVVRVEDDDVASIQLERDAYSATENEQRVDIIVRLNTAVALERPLRFRISTENGTAVSPKDFIHLESLGTFPSGSGNAATVPFSIVISDDDIVENAENFFVQLSVVDSALRLSSINRSTVAIVDNDVFEARFVQGDQSVDEEDLSITISVQLTGQHERNIMITLATIPLTATVTQDYTTVSSTLQFGPGESLKNVTIPILDDTTVEGTETFQVVISTSDPQVTILSPERITISIIDKDRAIVSFNQSEYTVTEEVGSSNVWVQLRNELQENYTVSVDVYNFQNTAQPPGDYSFASTKITVTFYGGQSQFLPVKFDVTDDDKVENDESFYVFVAANNDVRTTEPALSTVSIKDNDVAIVGFTKSLYIFGEDQNAVVEIELTNTLAVPVTVSLRTRVGTAINSDYGGISREDITFNTDESKKSISIQIIDDSVIEENENFTVLLETGNPRVLFSRSQTTVTIQDNDALSVRFESASYVVSESDLNINVIVLITGTTSFDLQVGIILEDATAKSGSDYIGTGSTLLLTPGVVRRQISVTLINDQNIEKNETFAIRLTNFGDSRINLGDINSTMILILDDDAATVEFTEELYSINEGSSSVNVSLNLTGILEAEATVRVSSFDVSATAGQDYTAIANQEITFSPGGPKIQVVNISINNDTLLEGTESFKLTASSSYKNIRIGKIANTTVRIIDDDVVSVDFVKETESVNEVNDKLQVEVEISGFRSRPVTVSVNSKDVSADGSDFTLPPTSITFQPDDNLLKTVNISIAIDDKVELDEKFELMLTTNDNQVIINDNKMTITIVDNDVAAVRFDSAESRVSENVTSLGLGVLLSGNLGISVSARVQLSPETAESADYLLPNDTLTFTPGTTRLEVVVLIDDDDVVESTETFLAQLTKIGPKVTLGSPDKLRVYIEDDDVARVRFENSSYVINENAQLANLIVVLVTNQPLQRDVSVRFSTEGDTALSPGDFSNVVGSAVIFVKGESNGEKKSVNVTVNNDSIVESREAFKVKLSLVDPGLAPTDPSTATVTIVDDDKASLGFSSSTYLIQEDQGPVNILVLLSGTIETTVSARINTVDATAIAQEDFVSISNQPVTFSPGDANLKNIPVTIVDDVTVEEAETFTAVLVEEMGVDIISGRKNATITIADNDVVTVTMEAAFTSVSESSGNAVVFVKASGARTKQITVNVSTFDATASAVFNDYTAKTQLVTLNPDDLQKPFIVVIKEDTIVENLEQFGVRITSSDPQVNIATETLLVSITDNDKLTLQIGAYSYSVSESVGNFTVTVTATGSTAVPISGSVLETDDGTAKAPTDYMSQVENFIFQPGDTTKDVHIMINNDGLTEELENFVLRLTSNNSAQITIGTPFTSSVIINDDDVSTVQFLSGHYSVNESSGVVNVSLSLSGSLGATVQININTQDDTATAGEDYDSLVSHQVTFNPGGDIVRTIPINIREDILVERLEEFTAVLSSTTPLVQIGNISSTRIRIVDNDVAGIIFANTSLVINEYDGVTSVAVEATGGLKTPVTVNVTVSDKTASSADYTVAPSNITMTFVPNGETRQFFNVTPIDDNRVEGDEAITAILSTTDPFAVIITKEMQITIKDNDKAVVNIVRTSFQIKEGEASSVAVAIELTGNLDTPVTVSLKTSNGTAVVGDYNPVDTVVTFLPGTSLRTVEIGIIDDNRVEEAELFSVRLSSSDSNVIVGPQNQSHVIILDNDGASLHFQSRIYNVSEAMKNVSLTVVLATNASLERAVTASFSLENGTAVSPEDFPASLATSVTFNIGDNNGKTKQVLVPIEDDDIVEPVQSFQVQLVTQENIIDPGAATIQIIDNDDVLVHFNEDKFYVNEADPLAYVTVNVEYTDPLQRPISINLNTTNNTAMAGEDYVALSSNFTILESDGAQKSFPIEIMDDALFEDEEGFRIHLFSDDPAVKVTSPTSANVFIIDNDDPVVRFEKDVYLVYEDSKTAQICILTSIILKDDIVLRVSTISGTAQAPLDFDAVISDITLNSTTPRCFVVTLKDDNIIEGNETFTVSLATTNPRVSIPNRIATVQIIDDDVNECRDKTHDCDANAFCTDTEESFTCTCNPGFTGDGRTCDDIDECAINLHNCHANASCINDVGSFHCDCKPGYTGDGVNACTDIIDCNPNPNSYPCHRFSNCLDTAGSYICFCPPGFVGDGYNFCNDTNECFLGTHNCHNASSCQNTRGSFICECQNGWTGDGQTCSDIDECEDGTHNCHQHANCTNLQGSFECSCANGFTGDGRTCADINECLTSPCHTDANCSNTEGSYRCVCRAGYSGDGKTCSDINECAASPPPCNPNALCTNTNGSYGCTCNSGFSGDGVTVCRDIDECGLETDNCHSNATCQNYPGSFNCTCYSGFSGNGVSCTNIDECKMNVCHQNASCNDTLGSYICRCNNGYTGNGTFCEDIEDCIPTSFDWPCHQKATCNDIPGSFVCSCRNGYTGNGFECVDIDECLLNTHNCHENATCQNERGKFDCQCKPGFIGNGVDCQDFNECNATNPCNTSTSVCENIEGDFRCLCKKGFTLRGKFCVDIDECNDSTISNCHSNASCINTFGSFMCSCKAGFSGDGETCLDIDECRSSPCDGNATCTNSPGSYECKCKTGFTGNGSTCTDINECPHSCHANATCTNVPGSFICLCNSSLTGDGKYCTDINECEMPNACPNATCTNFYGGYTCTCNEGFEKIGGETCLDRNECHQQPNICPANSNCVNLIGLYRCDCIPGFTGQPCEDIDECQTANDCNASAICNNTQGSYSCLCKGGYTGDGKTCDDINECSSPNTNDCHSNASCLNIPGSFNCTCKSGFNGNGSQCSDTDECLSTSTCHSDANCTNTIGSFTCTCKTGFTGDGKNCTDIRECNSNPCHGNATCEEKLGSFSCQCKSGFTGNGINCSDIEECNGNPCHENATCQEELDSYSCQCDAGYTGNGTYCSDIDECDISTNCHSYANCTNTDGSFSCSCNAGFTGNGRLCQDIKECNNNPCHDDANCTELLGSYSCTCNDGYSGNGTNCTDINECDVPRTCHNNATCSNTIGSFNCTCDAGFTGNGQQCEDIKECNSRPCHENADCSELPGSYSCQCKEGYTGNGSYCRDINECTSGSNNCHSNATCHNSNGSFACQCKDGFSGNGVQCKDRNECNETPQKCASPLTCENLYTTYRCNCPWGQYLINGICKDVLVFNLNFIILEGIKFSNDLLNRSSDDYLLLKRNLESAVNAAYGKSPISNSYLTSHLLSFSSRDTETIIANFSIFIDPNVTGLTTDLVGEHFTQQLTENAEMTKKILEQNYVLSKKESPAGFEPDPAAVPDDYNECSFNPLLCKSDEMCQNYPGTYRCYCSSPRQLKINDVCTDVITYEANILILNLDYTDALRNPNSLEFLQLAEAIQFQLNRYYSNINSNYQSSRVIDMRPGSILLTYLVFFKPETRGIQNGTLNQMLMNELPSNQSGTYLGPYRVNAATIQHEDYDECSPPNHVHVQDCDKNANCTNIESTYYCTCNDGYYGNGTTCTGLPMMEKPDPPKDDLWWLVYMIVFGVAFLLISMFILIVCCLENAEENWRYPVDETELVTEKNQYFFNEESMGFVNQDVELAPRNGNKEIYATTTAPTRLESYKVNPMFNDTKGSDQYDMQEKNETNGREEYTTL